MLGAMVGDVVGSRFEFHNHRSKEFELFSDQCEVTDDSIMTLAVAKAIMETERQGFNRFDEIYFRKLGKLTVFYMQKIGRKYPHCGYGGRFHQWVFSDNPEPYHSFGNGAAMRVSPVAMVAKTKEDVIKLSNIVTALTHDHPEGLKGAEATAVAIFMARIGYKKEFIREKIERDYYPLNFTIEEIRESYRFNETCQDTVPQAIEAFLESNSFEDAIRIAVSVGGDSDTLAAITGSIAEAYYGVPEAIKNQVLGYFDPYLRALYDEWEQYWNQQG